MGSRQPQTTTASFGSAISVSGRPVQPGPPACSTHPFEALTGSQPCWPSMRGGCWCQGPGSPFLPCRLPGPGCSQAHSHGVRDSRMFSLADVDVLSRAAGSGRSHSSASFLRLPLPMVMAPGSCSSWLLRTKHRKAQGCPGFCALRPVGVEGGSIHRLGAAIPAGGPTCSVPQCPFLCMGRTGSAVRGEGVMG